MARVPLEEAIERALGAAPQRGTEDVEASACVGRVLAEDLVYAADLPAFAHSAMDGYAIADAAAEGASFLVRGESRAGVPSSAEAKTGAAVAISTGAALPPGTTTVVPWEDVLREGDRVVLRRAARAGQHVRAAGEDARAGTVALSAGTRLGARHVAVLLSADRGHARVALRPRVALLSTGDELVDAGVPRAPGQIVDSNGPLVAALAAQAGADVRRSRLLDRDGALEAAIEGARSTSDLVVTIGGAADGDHDHVARALAALGAEWIFRGVAIKPGKPVGLARTKDLLVLALPGNPGSAYVTFALLGVPLLRAMQRDLRARPALEEARLAAPLRGSPDRVVLVYGALERRGPETAFVPGPPAPSGSVPALASAEAIALVPMGAELAAGDTLRALALDRL